MKQCTGRFYWVCIITAFCLFLCGSVAASPSPYASVTALDKYGHSVQLRHAGRAASKFGRLVVAARSNSNENTVVVVSIRTPKPGIILPGNNSNHGVLQQVFSDADLWMVCTGVKPDANWLLQQMRDYSKRIWERYDVAPSQTRLADALSEALLNFMGYDRKVEWHDGAGPVIINKDDQSWARPLGVSTLVVTPFSKIILVEASGVQHVLRAYAIGRDSDLVNQQLKGKYKSDMRTEEVKDLLVDVVRTALLKEANDAAYSPDKKVELVVEVVSAGGVKVDTIPLSDISSEAAQEF